MVVSEVVLGDKFMKSVFPNMDDAMELFYQATGKRSAITDLGLIVWLIVLIHDINLVSQWDLRSLTLLPYHGYAGPFNIQHDGVNMWTGQNT